ncbi:hypothetical protein AgCh_021901 [Apium graveolens]
MVEKIHICWRVGSRYLAEVPGGAIDGLLKNYIEEEYKLEAEDNSIATTERAQGASGSSPPYQAASSLIASLSPRSTRAYSSSSSRKSGKPAVMIGLSAL